MAVLAAMGLETIFKHFKSKKYPQTIFMILFAAAIIILTSLPAQSVAEKTNYESEMHLVLGIRQMELNQYDDAQRSFSKAIEIEPANRNAYGAMGLLLGRQGDYDRALEYHRKAIEVDPPYAKSFNNYALTLFEKGEYEQAIEICRKATQIDPYLEEPYYNWGMCLTALGKKAEAIEIYKRALDLMPRQDIMRNLAWLLASYPDPKVRDAEQAVYFAEMLCQSSEYKDPEHMFILAVAYSQAARFEDAVKVAQKAIGTISYKTDKKVYERLAYALTLFKQNKPFETNEQILFRD
jgi:Tfp pilus assembly protein PilF